LRILHIGFKGKNNSSYRLISELSGQKLFLTNSFAGLQNDIMSITGEYDLIIMLGLDASLQEMVRMELVAELGGIKRTTAVDFSAMCECFAENGIPCMVSESPTRYLCNAAYFYMLQNSSGKAVFMHVPSQKHMSEELAEKIVKSLGEIGQLF